MGLLIGLYHTFIVSQSQPMVVMVVMVEVERFSDEGSQKQ